MYSEVLFLALVAKLVAIVTIVETDTPYDKILSGVLGLFSRSCSLLWVLYTPPNSRPSSSIRLRRNAKQPGSQVISHQKAPSVVSSTVRPAKLLERSGEQAVASREVSSNVKSNGGQLFPSPKVGLRRPLRAPVSKGHSGAIHFGDHENCPTFFNLGNDKFALMENGGVFFFDANGDRHSVTEVSGTEVYFEISKEHNLLGVNSQGLLCEWDRQSEPKPLHTWCLDEPSSRSPRELPGLGCFFFNSSLYQKANCIGAGPGGCAPLNNSLHGSGLIPSSPTDVCGAMVSHYSDVPIHVHRVQVGYNNAGSSSQSPLPTDEISYGAVLPGPGNHASVARRTCTICSRVMRRPSALVTHLNSHNGIKPFACDIGDCDYASTTKANLERHTRTKHSNQAQ